MLRISRKGDYGLLLLTALAKKNSGDFVSLKQLAEKNKLPYKFLSQIAAELKEAELIESKEGIGGGYRLSRKPKAISVGEVLEVLDGPVASVSCMRGEECECKPFCIQKDVVEGLAEAVSKTMYSQSIADLIGENNTGGDEMKSGCACGGNCGCNN